MIQPNNIIVTTLGSKQRKKIRRAVRMRDGDHCWICLKLMHTHDMSIDHVIPKSDGGTNVLENFKLAHRFCNESRTWGQITRERMFALTPKQRRRIFG